MEKPEAVYAVRAPRLVGGKNRVGETCTILKRTGNYVSVRFEDGCEAVFSRQIVRQVPAKGAK